MAPIIVIIVLIPLGKSIVPANKLISFFKTRMGVKN